MGIIYKIEFENSKIYIGQTVQSLKHRHQRHLNEAYNLNSNGYNTALSRALRKHKNKFLIEIIEEVEEDQLNKKEIFYIDFYNSYKNGYNCTLGGKTTKGYKHTDESKTKMSKSKKQKYIGENNPFYGKSHSLEAKLKISLAQVGRVQSVEEKEKKSKNNKKHWLGKKLPQEMKNSISRTRKKKKLAAGNKNPMSYTSIMKRYECSLDKAKKIRKSFFQKETGINYG